MEPMITNSPMWEFGKRQNGNRFIGYTSSGTDWLPIACPTLQTVSESGSFFACVVSVPTSTSFGIATTCTRGSELPNPAGTFTCPGPCCSNTLYSSRGDTAPYHAYACGTCVSTLFRDIPSEETPSSSPAIETTSSSTSSTSTTSGSTPTSSNPNGSLYSKGALGSPSSSSTLSSSSSVVSSNAQAGTTSSPSSSPKEAGKAWIAGAVIGPVVGIAIISALVFYIWKLKRKGVVERERVVVVPGDAAGKAELDTTFGGGRSGYENAVEVHGQGVVEADGGNGRVGAVELPGWRGR